MADRKGIYQTHSELGLQVRIARRKTPRQPRVPTKPNERQPVGFSVRPAGQRLVLAHPRP